MTRISAVATAALVAFLLARPARADVPPYQPTEDACTGHEDGGACTVDLGMGLFQDGGSGYCQPGGTCTSQDPSICPAGTHDCIYPDAGVDPYGNQGPSSGITCSWGHGVNTDVRCYRHSACLACAVQAGSGTTSGSTSSAGSTSGSAGSSSGASTGGTTSGGSSAGATGGSSSGSTAGATTSAGASSSGSSGSTGSTKGGCSGAAGAVAPWLLALAVPALVRRKRGS